MTDLFKELDDLELEMKKMLEKYEVKKSISWNKRRTKKIRKLNEKRQTARTTK